MNENEVLFRIGDDEFTEKDMNDGLQAMIDDEWPHYYVKHKCPCPLVDEKNARCPTGLGEDCSFRQRKPN
jgi:hypothetical protein